MGIVISESDGTSDAQDEVYRSVPLMGGLDDLFDRSFCAVVSVVDGVSFDSPAPGVSGDFLNLAKACRVPGEEHQDGVGTGVGVNQASPDAGACAGKHDDPSCSSLAHGEGRLGGKQTGQRLEEVVPKTARQTDWDPDVERQDTVCQSGDDGADGDDQILERIGEVRKRGRIRVWELRRLEAVDGDGARGWGMGCSGKLVAIGSAHGGLVLLR